MTQPDNAIELFIEAAVWHGTLDDAERLRIEHPSLAASSLACAAIFGDLDAIKNHIACDTTAVSAPVGRMGATPLVLLCMSKYLRFNPERSPAFNAVAQALFEAGADANEGFWAGDNPREFESALYGAAAIVRDPALTKQLLDRGANANDEEVTYHTPEGYDLRTLQIMVKHGSLSAESLATMLLRKIDWHDGPGIRYLLDAGADPNFMTRWGRAALQSAVLRDNNISIIDTLLDAGADATARVNGHDVAALAARRGRGDVLRSLERRGINAHLEGIDTLIAACALADEDLVAVLIGAHPSLQMDLFARGDVCIAEFAGNGNTAGVACLLDLGVSIEAPYQGDGYYNIAPGSTPLIVAAWRARHETVQLLIDRGADVNARDGKGRTALMRAVEACVSSYWAYERSPESVRLLLLAGAHKDDISHPSGYAEVDALLE